MVVALPETAKVFVSPFGVPCVIGDLQMVCLTPPLFFHPLLPGSAIKRDPVVSCLKAFRVGNALSHPYRAAVAFRHLSQT